MRKMIVTIFDKEPNKIEHFINSIELRGLTSCYLDDLIGICEKADKVIKISFEDTKE